MIDLQHCPQCGKVMCIGDDVYTSRITEGMEFCSYKCLKENILEQFSEEVVDDWLDDHLETYGIEESNPYSRYGVSTRDFI